MGYIFVDDVDFYQSDLGFVINKIAFKIIFNFIVSYEFSADRMIV
ncbi:hypothetical protein FM107_14735 [Sphingobacterium sp. JB170]|nr:hypothetical protein FM107_14735 [Sphingobacterium sp. JB170]